jgi:hypothetical protein
VRSIAVSQGRILLAAALAASTSRSAHAAAPAWEIVFPSRNEPAWPWLKEHGFEEEKGSAAAWRLGEGGLTLLQKDDSTTVGTAKGFPIDPGKAPVLSFKIRVDELPAAGDLSKAKTEDAAFRLFVIFDEGGGLLSPPRTLGYAWASSGATGALVPSERFDTVRFIPVAAGQQGLGAWQTFTRNVVDDYKKAFGGDRVPSIKAIGIKSDANDTHGACRVVVEHVRLSPG